jgi:hypothetical protein
MGRCYPPPARGSVRGNRWIRRWDRTVARPCQRLPWERQWSNRKGRGVAETTEQEGTWTCERCGAVRPADWTCSCGGEGKGERVVPEGWDPELTRTSRPRLGLVARPEPEEAER